MKTGMILLMLAAVGLTGCQKEQFIDASSRPDGRYLGVGTYPVGQLWGHMVRKDAAKDLQAATLADDEQIIVTVDSHTGEVRQCGNLSGYCITSNAWTGRAAPAPAVLSKHAADLERENQIEKQ